MTETDFQANCLSALHMLVNAIEQLYQVDLDPLVECLIGIQNRLEDIDASLGDLQS